MVSGYKTHAVTLTSSNPDIVPHETVDDVIRIAREREEVEEVVKAELEANPGPPGRYYPFNDNTWKLYEEKTGKKPMGR